MSAHSPLSTVHSPLIPPGYKQTDVGVIPEEWEVSPFSGLFNITAGGDIDPKRSQSFQDSAHPHPIYSNALTNSGLYGYCSYADHPANSITITARGRVGGANYRDRPYTAIGRVLVLQPKSEMAGFYFAEVINNRVKFANESTGVPQLTAPQISKYRLPVPPPPEQRAIATALSDVDALLAGLDRLLAKKCDLKQAAMQQLLTGQTRLPGFKGKWAERLLSNIAMPLKGQGIRKDEVIPEGLPCVRYGEIYTHHTDYIRCFNSFISAETAKSSQLLRKGDLLFAGSGETADEIGKSVAFLGDEEAYAGGDIIIFRPQGQNSMFLGYLLNQPVVARQKAQMGQGEVIVHIGSRSLGRLRLSLPPLPEQTAIAEVLTEMDAELAALEQRREKTRALKQAMMQELLTGKTRLISRGVAEMKP
jgi:type I restriction enzyme S subunit